MGLTLRRASVAVAIVAVATLAAACDDVKGTSETRMETCLAAGGSYEDNGTGKFSCELPERP